MNKDMIAPLKQQMIDKLRAEQGLAPKQTGTKVIYDVAVQKGPQQANVTGCKEERGFVYLNLNGGDSWGYYHPANDARVIYNFKDEPNYLTKELCPEYYTQAARRADVAKRQQKKVIRMQEAAEARETFQNRYTSALSDSGKLHMAFRDRETDSFYIGYFDFHCNRHSFNTTSSRDKVNDYLLQHSVEPPDIIETWDYQFAPTEDVTFDRVNRRINQFILSPYMRNTCAEKDTQIPPTILRVVQHALGDDCDVVDHFVNWLSVIFKYRIRTQTAWVLQGTTGTGKGLLFNQILRPLLGEAYCRSITLPNLEDQFNKFMEHTLLLFVDEVDTDQVRDMAKLVARVKNMVTEPLLPLRGMRTDLREVPNHLNIIMASNQPNSMRVETNDRRFNIALRQEKKLLVPGECGEDIVTSIQSELQEFANFLQSYPADVATARRALDNAPKRALQQTTQTAAEEVAAALQKGDLAYFVEHLPDPGGMLFHPFNGDSLSITSAYRDVVNDAIQYTSAGQSHILSHSDLFSITELLIGQMPSTKAKLTKRMSHLGVQVLPCTQGKTSVRGYRVQWQATQEQLQQWSELFKALDKQGSRIHKLTMS